MIVVRLELWSAVTHKKTEIGTAIIYNDGTGTHECGNYDILIGKEGANIAELLTEPEQAWKEGHVAGFYRLEADAWDLLYEALEKAL